MRVSTFWPTPHDGYLVLDEVTTDEDAERYDDHGHPVVTIAADLAGAVGFAFDAPDLASPGVLRELHEIHVDPNLAPRTWHAGPRRPKTDEHGYLDGFPPTESPPANVNPQDR